MTELRWGDPPSGSRRGTKRSEYWVGIAAEVRSRPGVWAKLPKRMPPSTANNIASGIIAAFQPPGSFEAVSRESKIVDAHGRREGDIYVRYVGPT